MFKVTIPRQQCSGGSTLGLRLQELTPVAMPSQVTALLLLTANPTGCFVIVKYRTVHYTNVSLGLRALEAVASLGTLVHLQTLKELHGPARHRSKASRER